MKAKNSSKSVESQSVSGVAKGGRVTISPPSKVNLLPEEQVMVLASGIDSIYLSIDVFWTKPEFTEYLWELKSRAQILKRPVNGEFQSSAGNCPFLIKNHGSKGYEWIIETRDFSMVIGDWPTPGAKPSIMATLRSESLWRNGPAASVNYLHKLLMDSGATIVTSKISRLDLCVDVTMPERIWLADLRPYVVTRATKYKDYYCLRMREGLSIGKNEISARLYDKPLEIRQQSQKYWMYDIWGINEPPENHKIIRVEFQLRREALKELGFDQVDDIWGNEGSIWSYCSEKWLKFQDNPGKHHTQRHLLDWWETIQDGFKGTQDAQILVRERANRQDKKQLISQIYGLLTSLMAILLEELKRKTPKDMLLYALTNGFIDNFHLIGKDENCVSDEVDRKRALFHRNTLAEAV